MLLPALAEVIGKKTIQTWSSIVNVGITALLRYARIFIKGQVLNEVPVAVITDCV